jgi:ribosomal protein L40E
MSAQIRFGERVRVVDRQGSRFPGETGTVVAGPLPGICPWIVRPDQTDGFGYPFGWGQLEVIELEPASDRLSLMRVCQACQAKMAGRDTYCWRCGCGLTIQAAEATAPRPKNYVVCSGCEMSVPAGKFCGLCGAKLVAASLALKTSTCAMPECFAQVRANHRNCWRCGGSDFDARIQPRHSLPEASVECRGCGEEVPVGDFCAHCGAAEPASQGSPDIREDSYEMEQAETES